MSIRAGELDKRITIQSYTTTQNSYGEETKSWSDLVTVWAAVEPLQGREYWAAQKVNAELTVQFRIRYRAGITPKMRVYYDSRYFYIISGVNPKQRNEELILLCKEDA
jgi:SPP1 family predicted phage head-tail adaptor